MNTETSCCQTSLHLDVTRSFVLPSLRTHRPCRDKDALPQEPLGLLAHVHPRRSATICRVDLTFFQAPSDQNKKSTTTFTPFFRFSSTLSCDRLVSMCPLVTAVAPLPHLVSQPIPLKNPATTRALAVLLHNKKRHPTSR